MADRFHFNPTTGRTGKCSAEVQCRFGQSDSQHGATAAEARANYEGTMSEDLFSNTQTRPDAAQTAAKSSYGSDIPFAQSFKSVDLTTELKSRDFSGLRGTEFVDTLHTATLRKITDYDLSLDTENEDTEGRFLRFGLQGSFDQSGEVIEESFTLWISEETGEITLSDIHASESDIRVDREKIEPILKKLRLSE